VKQVWASPHRLRGLSSAEPGVRRGAHRSRDLLAFVLMVLLFLAIGFVAWGFFALEVR
jgi:hypothetical protein